MCDQMPVPPRNSLFKLVYTVEFDKQLDHIESLLDADIIRICKGCEAPIVFVEPRVGRFAESVIVEFWCWIPSVDSEKYWQKRFSDGSATAYNHDPRFDSFYSQTPR